MKQSNFTIRGIIVALFIVAACSSPTKKNHIGEPNNSILEAGILESGESYSMKIDTVGDIDWFALPVPGQGYLNISTKDIPENLQLVVRFAEKQEWEPTKHKWITGEFGLPATIPVDKPDTIYFVFKDKYHANASDEEIIFKAEFIEEFDEYESNNTMENAKTVATGDVIKSAFYPASDIDWFKTTVDSAGYLMLQARSVPENIQVEVRFAKKPDDFSDAEYISGGLGLPAAIQVSEPGDYYFYMKDKYNSNMSKDMAEWKIDFIEEIDSTEPNNNFDQAYRLSVNDTVRTAIFPLGDRDYFTLTPESDATLRIAAKHPKDLQLEIQLYEEVDFEQKPVGKWKALPTQIDVAANQKYYILLHNRYDNAYSREPVTFSVSEIGGTSDEPKTSDEDED